MSRLPLVIAGIALALAACSDDGGSAVADDAEASEEIAEAVLVEVHEALGLGDEVEELGSVTEGCVDSLGRDTGETQGRAHSRADPGVVSPERFESVGERLGATDVRASDVQDPFDTDKVIGRRISVFADHSGRRVTVTMQLTDEAFSASVRAACP
jgi:hypothetical protein